MKKVFFLGVIAGIILSLSGTLIFFLLPNRQKLLQPVNNITSSLRPKPLLAYTYENLRKRTYEPSEIKFEKILATESAHLVWQVSYQSEGKRISGTVNLPKKVSVDSVWEQKVIIMVHGYADKDFYYPGYGTEHLAAYLADNGYVTVSPDLRGFGTSDKPSHDSFEERFENYVDILNLVASIERNCSLLIVHCSFGLWGHSNGGQIALTVLEITGKKIPAVLWNPVSATFPFSILYFSDELSDQGKWLRRATVEFEEDYDSAKFNPINFYDWIIAPIFIQQGGADEQVPRKWSDILNKGLADRGKRIGYKVYPNNDHNMLPNWNMAAADALKFFQKEL